MSNKQGIKIKEIFIFGLGALTWSEINLVGKLYIGEIILAIYAIMFLTSGVYKEYSNKYLKTIFLLWCLYFLSLIISDLYRGSTFLDYSRGWSRAVFLLTNAFGLFYLGAKNKSYLYYWLSGSIISLWLQYLLMGGYSMNGWKFGLSTPLIFSILLLVNSRKNKLVILILALLGIINIILDFRSMAGFCFASLFLYLLSIRYKKYGYFIKDVKVSILAFLMILSFAYLYNYSQKLVAISADNTEELAQRRQYSDAFRIAGFYAGAKAIAESPIIGLGSWAKSNSIFAYWAYIQYQAGGGWDPSTLMDKYTNLPEQNSIQTHSQIIQAWVEAGILGFVFFIYFFIILIKLLIRFLESPIIEKEFIFIVFFSIQNIYALLLSPFAGGSRLLDAMALVLLYNFIFKYNLIIDPK
ncbi:O-antigen ligase family protein [Stygiobacter electus]|uniref:O-antigen ligase-related domain-containing protein n=1 Tax=Stygiobacter electus TaxID=3032292 RepID=A0AAE3TF57_9BACT|nr:O-antigen ligase family protein [Stygiobacter electus]MDF1613097.1 hypothetical protein [Stygiobacter electus]